MEKVTNIFILGVVLLGSALLRILESFIHRTFPVWLLVTIGIVLCGYGIATWQEKHPKGGEK